MKRLSQYFLRGLVTILPHNEKIIHAGLLIGREVDRYPLTVAESVAAENIFLPVIA